MLHKAASTALVFYSPPTYPHRLNTLYPTGFGLAWFWGNEPDFAQDQPEQQSLTLMILKVSIKYAVLRFKNPE